MATRVTWRLDTTIISDMKAATLRVAELVTMLRLIVFLERLTGAWLCRLMVSLVMGAGW